jgi:hypothetical protein
MEDVGIQGIEGSKIVMNTYGHRKPDPPHGKNSVPTGELMVVEDEREGSNDAGPPRYRSTTHKREMASGTAEKSRQE